MDTIALDAGCLGLTYYSDRNIRMGDAKKKVTFLQVTL
jgi:hypothetical protein